MTEVAQNLNSASSAAAISAAAGHTSAGPDRKAYSIDEFCQAYRICRASFYNLLKQDRGPRTMKVGGRTLVSIEAADEWRRQMESQAAGKVA
jgi:hypothetical protein